MKYKYLVLAIIIAISSCNELPFEIQNSELITYISNAADFTVINLSSSESIHNKGIIISTDETTEAMDVFEGQTLLLTYSPPEKYAEGIFDVSFYINGMDYSISKSPYQVEIPIGKEYEQAQHPISCSAKCSLWTDQSQDFGMVYINIK